MDKKEAETILRAFREQAEINCAMFEYMQIVVSKMVENMSLEEYGKFFDKLDEWHSKHKDMLVPEAKNYREYFRDFQRGKHDKPN